MKKKLLGFILGLLVLLVLVLAMAPANTIIPMIKQKLPANLKAIELSNISGTIWSPEIATISYKEHSLENVKLAINPLNLVLGDLDVDLSVEDPQLTLTAELLANTNKLALNNLNFDLKGEALDPFMQFPVNGLSGVFNGTIDNAHFNRKGVWQQIEGRGDWKNAFVHYMDKSLALGNIGYLVKTDSENNLILEIIDNDGALDIKGDFLISANKSYNLDLTTSTKLPNDIEMWVKQLGRLENNRYRIRWAGQLK